MYGGPNEFLLSNLKGLDESRYMVPPYLARLCPLSDYENLVGIPGVKNFKHLQQCAVLWHTQIYHFSRLAAETATVEVLLWRRISSRSIHACETGIAKPKGKSTIKHPHSRPDNQYTI